MSFTKTPAGASSGFALIGTDFIDITTIAGSAGPVEVFGFGDRDQVTIQSTNGVADSFNVNLGGGDDRLFADARPNLNLGDFFITNSIFRGGDGDDILFGDVAGDANLVRTAFFQDSWIFGNTGGDIIRTYGLLNSGVEGNRGSDKIELTNDFTFAPALGQFDPLNFFGGELGIINNEIVNNPDRYDNSTISGGNGSDTVELKLGNTNVVNSKITGNAGNDLVTNFRINDLSGNFQNTTIFGARGSDTVDLQDTQIRDFENNVVDEGFVTSDLLVFGGRGRDFLRTGIGNDTVVGNAGDDFINDAGGQNLIAGDTIEREEESQFFEEAFGFTSKGSGDDIIEVNVSRPGPFFPDSPLYEGKGNAAENFEVFANRNNFNTVFAGDGADTVIINSDQDSFVFGDNKRSSTTGGDDTINIFGDGNNVVTADGGDDTVRFNGGAGGSNTVFGRAGDDHLISLGLTGAASVSGGSGYDTINYNRDGFMASAIFDGGKDADLIINAVDNRDVTYIQENGDSVEATAIRNLDGEFFRDGASIRFANGVDIITNFGFDDNGVETNIFDTDLGQLGLDQALNGGEGGLYDGNELSAQSGFIFGRSYYLRGNIAPVDNGRPDSKDDKEGKLLVFTIDAQNGEDAILVTEGNNRPFTENKNLVVLEDYGDLIADLNNSNFI